MGPIGIPELIVIFIVALVVFGPKKLPELGKSLGKGLREFNKAKNELKATWDEQIREAESSLNSVKETVHEPVRKSIASIHDPAPESKTESSSHPETQSEPPHPPPAGTEA
jgi:sec-independent protein translocase protein TatA